MIAGTEAMNGAQPTSSLPETSRLADLLTVALLAGLLGVLAWLALREDYWLDEGYSVRRAAAAWRQLYDPFAVQAAQPADPFDARDVFDYNPPLYFAVLRLCAGAHPRRLGVRLVSALPLVAGLALLALRARRVAGWRGQLAVAAVGATIPAAIYYGHEARPYALPLGVVCLLLWAIPKLWRRPVWLGAACCGAAAAGALMHFAFAWWIISQFLIFCVVYGVAWRAGDAANRRAALAGMAGLAAGALLALALLAPQFGIFTRSRASTTQTLTAEVIMNSFAIPFSRVGGRPLDPAAAAAVQFLVFLALALPLRDSRRQREGLLALGLWLLPLALPALAHAFLGITYYERYTLFALPGWLMALAWIAREASMIQRGARSAECEEERPARVRVAVGALFVLILGVNGWWIGQNLRRPLRSQWRPAARLVARLSKPDEAYTIDPDLEHRTFAVNAESRPAARYFSFSQGVPPEAGGLWIVTETHINPNPKYDFDPARWTTEKMLETSGIAVFHARRK